MQYQPRQQEIAQPEPVRKPLTQEIDSSAPLNFPKFNPQKISHRTEPVALEMSDWGRREKESAAMRIKSAEPLFIKLDKFENAISTFNEVKLRVAEISSLLRDVRAIKTREEKEIDEAEKEIDIIKSRLDQIEREVFHNL